MLELAGWRRCGSSEIATQVSVIHDEQHSWLDQLGIMGGVFSRAPSNRTGLTWDDSSTMFPTHTRQSSCIVDRW